MNTKQQTIGLRITEEHKEIIRLAAKARGEGISSFMINVALQEAKKVKTLPKKLKRKL